MTHSDVCIVVNAHREAAFLHPCLTSVLNNVNEAGKYGIVCELFIILDRPDEVTRSVALRYADKFDIRTVNFGDLSTSRNFACSLSKSKYVTFLDGDDIWGHRWVASCFSLAEQNSDQSIVIHPRLNLFFGRGLEPYFWIHPDMRYVRVSSEDILANNRWTALSFARRDIYERFPYRPNRISEGFGYEDWAWHIQTILAGVIHIVAEDTIHFIRRKEYGSLLSSSNAARVMPYLMDNEEVIAG